MCVAVPTACVSESERQPVDNVPHPLEAAAVDGRVCVAVPTACVSESKRQSVDNVPHCNHSLEVSGVDGQVFPAHQEFDRLLNHTLLPFLYFSATLENYKLLKSKKTNKEHCIKENKENK